MKPWFPRIPQIDVGKKCVAVTVRDKYNLSKRFPTFFFDSTEGQVCPQEPGLARITAAFGESSELSCDSCRPWTGEKKKKKKPTHVTRVQTKRHQCHFSTHFILCVWRELSIKSFFFFFYFGVKFFFFHLVAMRPCLLKQELSRVAFNGEISGRNHISIQLIVRTARCQFSCYNVNCNKFT